MEALHLLLLGGAAAFLFGGKKKDEGPSIPDTSSRVSTDSGMTVPAAVQIAQADPTSDPNYYLPATIITRRSPASGPPDRFGCMLVSSFSADDAMALFNQNWVSTGSVTGGYGSLCPPGTDLTCDQSLSPSDMATRAGCSFAAGMRNVQSGTQKGI